MLGFFTVALGLFIMTSSSMPATGCGTIDKDVVYSGDKDLVDAAMLLSNRTFLLGGILAIIGGGVGMCGGFTLNKYGVCAAAILLSIAAVFIVVGCWAAHTFAEIAMELCDSYVGSAIFCWNPVLSAI